MWFSRASKHKQIIIHSTQYTLFIICALHICRKGVYRVDVDRRRAADRALQVEPREQPQYIARHLDKALLQHLELLVGLVQSCRLNERWRRRHRRQIFFIKKKNTRQSESERQKKYTDLRIASDFQM